MTIKQDYKDDLQCLRITLTYDEVCVLKNSPQKAWLWKRFWALVKYYV
jgi:hypothetical protein